jgi:aldehyde dehydrogenase (NAD+)
LELSRLHSVWKMAPALVAGTRSSLKPAPETPWSASLVGELFEQAGLPKGVLGIVPRRRRGRRKALIDHPDVQGDLVHRIDRGRGDRSSADAASSTSRCKCELGGKNPLVVLADADLDAAARAIALGAFGRTGQRCTATLASDRPRHPSPTICSRA